MNERIRELYKEAEKYVAFLSNSKESKQLILQEKFAELIVRECAEICDAYGMPDGTSQTAMVLSRAIKKHFGVER